ncbi:MAG: Phosphoesterase [uncultured Sulfurovum sp.]|uniref:Phosphoesterase n=1 Tax=uncultured Sulfurovum sp. TaxID=269237 RepID=A0A6S6TMZ2_9BACT|nr:MAG: Phosphoesterase [uncultured Sulfurovum sp.]
MSQKLKIGILSDSHMKTALHQEAVDHLCDLGVNYLLHAGDIMLEEHLQMLVETGLPYACVYGNNDTSLISLHGKYNIFQEPHYFSIENLKVKMMHMPYYMSADADIVVSGHTHMFETSLSNETLFINPGEVCGREKPLSECAMVIVENGSFEVEHYFRELSQLEWTKREIEL